MYNFIILLSLLSAHGLFKLISIGKRFSNNSFSQIPTILVIGFVSLVPYAVQVESSDYIIGYKSQERWETANYMKHYEGSNQKSLKTYGVQLAAIEAIMEVPLWTSQDINIFEESIEPSEDLPDIIKNRALYDMNYKEYYFLNYKLDSPVISLLLTNYREVYLFTNINHKEDLTRDSSIDEHTSKLQRSTVEQRYVIFETENYEVYKL